MNHLESSVLTSGKNRSPLSVVPDPITLTAAPNAGAGRDFWATSPKYQSRAPMYDAILLPTDGRPNTERAIEEAIELAAAHNATLHTLYVINSAEIAPGMEFDDLDPIGDEAVEYVATRAREAGIDDVRTSVTHGLRRQSILDYADAHAVDLIVMGRHRGLDRFFRTSVSDRVSKDASISVLVVE